MQKRHWKRYILTIVLLAWAGIILYLSFQDASNHVKHLLQKNIFLLSLLLDIYPQF